MAQKIKVLLVDDHPLVREGVANLILQQPDMEVCGEAATEPQALQLIGSIQPNVAVVDLSLENGSGLELIKSIKSMHPAVAMLALSMHDESLYAERVLRAGGRGYIMKQEGGKKLLQAVRHVLSGQIYVSEKMAAGILETFSGRHTEVAASPVQQLSDREFEVFQLIGQGKSTREIAVHLHLSAKTVEVHRLNIKKKLKLKTATDLVRHAVRWLDTEDSGA